MKRLDDKRVLVVGASSGIGRLVATRFIDAGCRVTVAARRAERLEQLRLLAPDRVSVAVIDVNAYDAADRVAEAIDTLGGVDIYFHAAGLGFYNSELLPEHENLTVETNVSGFTRCIDVVFRRMVESGGGHIAAITSIAQTKGIGVAPSYSASKRFQATYITALDQLSRIRRLGISFTDIRPGFVNTDFLRGDAYPMLLTPEYVAHKAFRATLRRRRVATIDWRYRLLVGAWRILPRWLWVRLPVKSK